MCTHAVLSTLINTALTCVNEDMCMQLTQNILHANKLIANMFLAWCRQIQAYLLPTQTTVHSEKKN